MRPDKVIFAVVEVEKVCFSTRNVLKFNLHTCRVCAMLVDSCFSAGKIRYSRFYCCGSPVEIAGMFQNQECAKIQFPQL